MEKNFIIAGFGGQGVLLAGEVLANAFMVAGKNVTWYPCYGAEMRGGTVNCEIVMNDTEEVSAVNKKEADFVVALNQASVEKFVFKIKKGGWMIANSSLAKEIKTRADINYLFAPITKLAENVGNIKMTNILALGILAKVSKLVTLESLNDALDAVIPAHRKNLMPLNLKALKIGYEYDLLPV
ncbi:MAG: 2-oxoacid:acceptor oxidoreductase family protein [Brachyspira sp.]|jgi:2-oxoacid:acceptor oxidoreductase, gamma subunit, pyruvate/2-ketoisovalerate family|nr:2-oxoacid:acceptor oxidoreductase family protein [Brachyspira sp.]